MIYFPTKFGIIEAKSGNKMKAEILLALQKLGEELTTDDYLAIESFSKDSTIDFTRANNEIRSSSSTKAFNKL